MTIRLFATLALALALVGMGRAVSAQTACVPPTISKAQFDDVVSRLRNGSYGRYPSVALLALNFTSPDEPPRVEVLYFAGEDPFLDYLREEAKVLRAPCVASAGPVQATFLGRFAIVDRVDGRGLVELEPRLNAELAIKDVVRIVKDLPSQKVRFDFTQMGCPFVVTFAPLQPYAPNAVQEGSSDSDPRRAAFLQWLRSLTLDIPKDMMRSALGRESNLYVPCAVLDLS